MSNSIIAGRLYDIAMFQNEQATGETQLVASLAVDGQSGTVLTGIAKLAQRVLLELYTEQGSMPFTPTRGTTFMSAARQGSLRTELDVFQEFAFAAGTIQSNLLGDQTDTDPLDECFGTLELEQVMYSGTTLVLHMTLTSQAGSARTVYLPVSAVP